MEKSLNLVVKDADATNLMYFVAGALLPTLALVLLRQFRPTGQPEEYDDDDESDDGLPAPTGGGPQASAQEWGIRHAPYKMVLCVNQELSMGKGKIAAQCCHAAVGCYKRARKQCPAAVTAWENTGCAKVALKCPTQEGLEDIAVRALAKGIPCYYVADAGRTQIAAGSRTVLGLGPAPVSVFEGVSDHLKLM